MRKSQQSDRAKARVRNSPKKIKYWVDVKLVLQRIKSPFCPSKHPSQTWNKESLKKRFNSLKNLHFVEDFLKIKKWENKNQKKIILL